MAAEIVIEDLIVDVRVRRSSRFSAWLGGAGGRGDATLEGAKQGPLIDRLNLRVPASSICAIVGRSGCGKTTLLKSIAGILDERVLSQRGRVAPRGGAEGPSMGMVFQHSFLFPWRTALENVQVHGLIAGQNEQARVSNARALLADVGLASHEHKYPRALSGGMQQRVALAREFARRLDVLLMDEPFRLLDRVTQESLIDCLLGFWKRFQPTVVIVTHDPSEAVQLADQIVVMERGRITETRDVSASLGSERGMARRDSADFGKEVKWVLDHLPRDP